MVPRTRTGGLPTRWILQRSLPWWRRGRAFCACTNSHGSSAGSAGGIADGSSGGADGISGATPGSSGHHHHTQRFVRR
jgi:hypothetical protein